MMRLPWQLPLNGALNIQQLWASGGLTRERVWWNLVHNSKLGPQWQSCDQILKFLKFKMADSRHVGKWKCYNTPTDGPIGPKLEWSHPTNTSTAETFSLVLVATANRTMNVLVLLGVEIKNTHNFDEIWMTMCHCVTKKYKNLVEKQQILIQKNLKIAIWLQAWEN